MPGHNRARLRPAPVSPHPSRPRRPPAGASPPAPASSGPARLVTARHVWLVFGAALAVRLLHLWQMAGTPYFTVLMGDARGYDQWARRLAAGDWIGTDVFYQAPLYPYFLGVVYAVLGADPGTARLVQAVIGAASAALLAVSAARLFGARAGLIAGLTLALYAPAIFLDSLLQKSVLDVFFVSGIVTALAFVLTGDDRRRWWALAGLAAGALALTRENALVLVAVVAAWIGLAAPVGRVGRAQALALFLAGVVAALAPVAARNFAVSGEVYLTTSQFGPNFYIGNNAEADGSYQSLRFGRGSPEFERVDATELAERSAGRALTPAEVSSYWTGRATAFITEQPRAWLALTVRKAALLVNAREAIDTESQESYAEWSWPLTTAGRGSPTSGCSCRWRRSACGPGGQTAGVWRCSWRWGWHLPPRRLRSTSSRATAIRSCRCSCSLPRPDWRPCRDSSPRHRGRGSSPRVWRP